MVPVEAKVAATLQPIWPDLPSPHTISLPGHWGGSGPIAFSNAGAEAVGERIERPRLVAQHLAPEIRRRESNR